MDMNVPPEIMKAINFLNKEKTEISLKIGQNKSLDEIIKYLKEKNCRIVEVEVKDTKSPFIYSVNIIYNWKEKAFEKEDRITYFRVKRIFNFKVISHSPKSSEYVQNVIERIMKKFNFKVSELEYKQNLKKRIIENYTKYNLENYL